MGQPIGPVLQMGPIGCPEMSVTKNLSTQRDITEERRLHPYGGDSGVPRNFVRWGVQQIQLRTEDRENGDLGAVAP